MLTNLYLIVSPPTVLPSLSPYITSRLLSPRLNSCYIYSVLGNDIGVANARDGIKVDTPPLAAERATNNDGGGGGGDIVEGRNATPAALAMALCKHNETCEAAGGAAMNCNVLMVTNVSEVCYAREFITMCYSVQELIIDILYMHDDSVSDDKAGNVYSKLTSITNGVYFKPKKIIYSSPGSLTSLLLTSYPCVSARSQLNSVVKESVDERLSHKGGVKGIAYVCGDCMEVWEGTGSACSGCGREFSETK